ncbi:MAG: hypothetical protein KJ850_07790 [Gammaproteobacteria bacterium]|nr:hypothetical protein [Gammaproteobacteria bacterium]MBU1624938.1 hypothetical protein [Gammaproteobacteria bacterium]MBU1982237.1 hypothetical protein [Gammaproteobacteria bacterium]
MTASRRPTLLLILILLLTGCRGADVWRHTEIVPIQPGQTLHLRVAHAVNERLPRMTPEQLSTLLEATRNTALEHFGVHLEFSEITETSVDAVLALVPPKVRQVRMREIYDFKSGGGDHKRLVAGILHTLHERKTKLAEALAYARPYLPDTADPQSLQEFSVLLADVMLARLDDWRTIRANDGKPVLDETARNEWIFWDTVGYGELPYDLVITNQLLASAEYTAVEVHTAIRGGLTTGTTTFSRSSPLGSFVFWSTFPFTDTSAFSRSLRGGEDYAPSHAAALSGAYLAHEVGHLLFKFGHPFGAQACVMNPASMLRYREWHQQLDAQRCRIGSIPEMRVGAIPEIYNVEWLRMAHQP